MKKSKSFYFHDIRRKIGGKKPKQSILIVCEGDKTEPNYFKKLGEILGILRANSVQVEVDIHPSNHASAPRSVVAKARELKQQRDDSDSLVVRAYDRVYCIIDVEIPPHTTLKEAIDTARQVGEIDIILSNPCFEYWLRLHYGHTGSNYHDSKAVLSDLKKYCPKYDKGVVEDEWFDEIKIKSAIKNAKNVLKQHCKSDDLTVCNPSTDVYRVVEYMQEMAQINKR